MCIRDRKDLSSTIVMSDMGLDGAVAGAGFLTKSGNGTLTPVSYTHLRAHETVLDLVCRLLLEQKKTT